MVKTILQGGPVQWGWIRWAVLPALRLRRRVAFPREGPKVAGRPLRVQPLRGPVHRHYQDPDALHEAPVKGMASCPVLDPHLLEGRVVRDPREAARSQAGHRLEDGARDPRD